jgi:hypothetical protein
MTMDALVAVAGMPAIEKAAAYWLETRMRGDRLAKARRRSMVEDDKPDAGMSTPAACTLPISSIARAAAAEQVSQPERPWEATSMRPAR